MSEATTGPGGDREPARGAPPHVCVVTAAHNVADFIGETLASVLAQSLRDIEIIVVDDGSTDATAEVAAGLGDPRIRVISTPNRGVSAARNRGLAECRAPYVLFLDGDDLLTPDALERMAAALDERPRCVAAVALLAKIDLSGRPLGRPDPARLPSRDILRQLVGRNFIVNGGAICMRTHAARAVGGFDPRLRLGEDWDLWCRLAALGEFAMMPDLVSALYRVRPSGANVQLGGTALAPNFEAVEAVFSRPEIRANLTTEELLARRRLAELNAYWSAARNALVQRRLGHFLVYLGVGLWRYPDSLLQGRLIARYVAGAFQMSRS
ncbi:glycosyltransferase family 2 protein [Alsobacter sp. SYSU M60028]|uniref:Glycosyltransferase family 2 protein n=1 Tax=Alsobacter ponti TaxID=2962936 RepID=A0ABT1LFV1_9HYPH|nr:glycosyltransferase family 2 protein [Alsobacter ponti]MCP8939773.1 glycosyltransferase family 2 protein [Alsobacter ponti]